MLTQTNLRSKTRENNLPGGGWRLRIPMRGAVPILNYRTSTYIDGGSLSIFLVLQAACPGRSVFTCRSPCLTAGSS
jgi:hypothetical protein